MSDKKTPSDPSTESKEETEFVPIKVNSINPVRFAIMVFSIVLTIGLGVWGVMSFQKGGYFNRQTKTQTSVAESRTGPKNPGPHQQHPDTHRSDTLRLTFLSKWADTQTVKANCTPLQSGKPFSASGKTKVVYSDAPPIKQCFVTATNSRDQTIVAEILDVPGKRDQKQTDLEYECFAHGQQSCVPKGFLGISFIPQEEVGNFTAECFDSQGKSLISAKGQGRLDMSISSADRCQITREKDDIGFSFENPNPDKQIEAGNYSCFVKGQPVCVPEGQEEKVVPLYELSKEEEKRLKKEKGPDSFKRPAKRVESELEVTGPGWLSISADWESIVFIDGKKIRKSPLYKHSVKSGKRRISLFSEEGRIQRFSITVKSGHLYTYQWSFEKNDWIMKDVNNRVKDGTLK